MTTIYYVDLTASRIANSNRSDQSGVDDGDVTGWTKTDPIILAIQVATSKGPLARAYKLMWRNVTDGGSFADVASTGQVKWAISTDTVLVDDGILSTGNMICTGTPEPTQIAGLENEEDNTLPDTGTMTVGDEEYTEQQWGLNLDDALDGKQYEFQLYDVTETTIIGTTLAQITIAAGVLSDQVSRYLTREVQIEARVSRYLSREVILSDRKSRYLTRVVQDDAYESRYLSRAVQLSDRKSRYLIREVILSDRDSRYITRDVEARDRKSRYLSRTVELVERVSRYLTRVVILSDRESRYLTRDVEASERVSRYLTIVVQDDAYESRYLSRTVQVEDRESKYLTREVEGGVPQDRVSRFLTRTVVGPPTLEYFFTLQIYKNINQILKIIEEETHSLKIIEEETHILKI